MRGYALATRSALYTLAIICLALTGCAKNQLVNGDAAQKVVKERLVVDTRSLYDFPEGKPVQGAQAMDIASATAPPQEFQIGAGDVLNLEVFDDVSLNREVAVRYDGMVSLPLINEVSVAGRTRAEAEAIVKDAYRSVFREPRVSLTVVEPQSKSFFILGDVAQPDEYPYKRPISLLEAINIAGGLRVDTQATDSTIGAQGQLTKAFIIRKVNGQRVVLDFDLTGIRNPGEHPSEAPVLPGDMIYVPEGMNLVYIMGEVRAPQVYPLIEGMTLLELVARAGGPVESRARMTSIVLFRKLDDGRTEAMLIDLRRSLQTGYSPRLMPGDIVYVPRNPLERLHDNIMHFTRLTETVSPLLSLYMQAYDAYYTDRRYDQLFDDDYYGDSPLGILETLRDLLP